MKKLVCATAVYLALMVSSGLAEEVQTLKERLSDKASDAQRVDNCHVPAERRGSQPRPDCPAEPQAAAPQPERDPSTPRAQR